jgi:ribosomal protein L11 methyltransferase
MPWLSVSLEVDADSAEPLVDALLAAGVLSVDLADADAGTPDEAPQFGEPGSPPAAAWHRSRVTALLASGADAAALIPAALHAAGLPESTQWHARQLDDQDWVRMTQAQFSPVQISPRLWIVPSWCAPSAPEAINITLDPGLAFGTGTHPTTRLALRWLEDTLRGGDTVIDYGCGSGILAIAAMRLGAARATGVDIDGQALLAARHNALQNRVEVRFVAAADEIPEPAGVVVANILANPLVVLAPLLAKLTAPGGRLALSGLLAAQADEVRGAYAPWFDMDRTNQDEGWILLGGTRR